MTWLLDVAVRLGLGLFKWIGLAWLVGQMGKRRRAEHVAKVKGKQLEAALKRPRDKRDLVDRLRRDGL